MNNRPGGSHPSDGATRLTLGRMRALVRAAVADGQTIRAARAIVAQIPPRDQGAQARAIRAYLAARLRFIPDPLGVELLDDPRAMLADVERQGFVQGDCDAAATLGASLAGAIGVRSSFVVVAFGDAGAPFQHVWTVLHPKGAHPVELDVTRPAQRLPLTVSRSLVVKV